MVPKRRTTSEVQGHVSGDTVVLRGLSSVEQCNADGKTWRTNRYQFMRAYVNVESAGFDSLTCTLLA